MLLPAVQLRSDAMSTRFMAHGARVIMMRDRLGFFGAFEFCAALPISRNTNYGQLFNYIRQRHPLDRLRALRFMDNWMIHIITTIMQQASLESCGYLTSRLFAYWITSSSVFICFYFRGVVFIPAASQIIVFFVRALLDRKFNCFYGLTFNCCSWWPEVSR